MVKKRVLAYMLLSILSFQLLPIQEVINFYKDNQVVEEICHSANADGKNAEGNEDLKKNDFLYTAFPSTLILYPATPEKINAACDFYVSRLSDDAPTRPPLGFC